MKKCLTVFSCFSKEYLSKTICKPNKNNYFSNMETILVVPKKLLCFLIEFYISPFDKHLDKKILQLSVLCTTFMDRNNLYLEYKHLEFCVVLFVTFIYF